MSELILSSRLGREIGVKETNTGSGIELGFVINISVPLGAFQFFRPVT